MQQTKVINLTVSRQLPTKHACFEITKIKNFALFSNFLYKNSRIISKTESLNCGSTTTEFSSVNFCKYTSTLESFLNESARRGMRPANASPAKVISHGGHPTGSPGDRRKVVRSGGTTATVAAEAVVGLCLVGWRLNLVLRIQPIVNSFEG